VVRQRPAKPFTQFESARRLLSNQRDADELTAALLEAYFQSQGRTASGTVYGDPKSAWPYYEAHYGAVLRTLPRSTEILELGSGHGSLLAWLRSLGFERLAGVDASPGDVAFANEQLGAAVVELGDAIEYLRSHRISFDLVLAKALVEHIPRRDLLALVDALADALRTNGMAVIDVPNMDWMLAGHERYMDLTHRIGFTRESLRSLLVLRFGRIEIRGSVIPVETRAQRVFRRPLVRTLRWLLYVLGEGASEALFESRSLIAFATKTEIAAHAEVGEGPPV
jgi:SAM-dependent methyltransferase